MNVGRMNRFVSLYHKPTNVTDPVYDNPLDPPTAWVQIQPLDPTTTDERRMQASRVTMRYHPQVTIDTHMVYGSRTLFVRGVQNTDDYNAELILFCEEVVP